MTRGFSAAGRRLTHAVIMTATAWACVSAQNAGASFDGRRALGHVTDLVAIGPRVAGSAGAERARAYITKQITALGLQVREQPFMAKTPVGLVKMVNLRVTLPGAAASGRLILAGHYDTKLFQDIVFVGANDGGSSAAFLIEIARVLKDRRNALPIELLFFDGEEAIIDWHKDNDHTYGSQYYVDAARQDGTLKDIRALILVDMIGDRDLRILREPRSTRWLTDVIWRTAKTLKRPEFVDEEFEVEDDHIPFLDAGVQAIDLIDLDYPDWHRAGDTVDKLSAASLQAVGDVLLAALPVIEKRLITP
jgi:glutaminyl-peptide cyclotransferase